MFNRPRNCRDCISIQVTYACGLDYCCTKESVNPECVEKSSLFQSFRKASELYPIYFTFSAMKNQWTNTPKSLAFHNYSCRIFRHEYRHFFFRQALEAATSHYFAFPSQFYNIYTLESICKSSKHRLNHSGSIAFLTFCHACPSPFSFFGSLLLIFLSCAR